MFMFLERKYSDSNNSDFVWKALLLLCSLGFSLKLLILDSVHFDIVSFLKNDVLVFSLLAILLINSLFSFVLPCLMCLPSKANL